MPSIPDAAATAICPLGYYCSLLAEARRQRVIRAMRAITDLSAKAIYSLGAEDLDAQVRRSL